MSPPGSTRCAPLRIRLGAAWAWGESWIGVEADAQTALDSETFTVHRRFTVNVRAGALLAIAPRAWIGLGMFTDRSPDSTPEGLLESRLDYLGGTVGVRLDHAYGLAAGERAPSLVFSTTIALRYGHGSGETGGVAFGPPGGEPGENRPVSAEIHELAVHLGSSVYF